MVRKMKKFKTLSISEIKEMLSSMKVIPKSIKIFFQVKKSIFIFIIIINIIAGILPVISVNVLGTLINVISTTNLDMSLKILAIYIGISFLLNIVLSIKNFLTTKFQYLLDYELVNKLMNKCANMSLEEFENPDVQDQLKHIQSQIGYRPYSIFTAILTLITSITTILSSIFSIIIWQPSAILFIITPSLAFSIFYLSISKREFQTEENNAKKSRNIWYYEFLLTKDQSFKEVKILNLAKHLINRNNDLKKTIIKENLYNTKVRLIISIVFDFIDQICMMALMILIILSVNAGKLLIGGAVSLLRIINMVFDSFNSIMNIIYSINQNSLYMYKLINFIHEPKIKHGDKKIYRLEEINDIEINDLSFCYPGTNKKVLKNINLKINKGEKIAFFGRNGSGKSTLIKLLLGYYLVDDSMIKINGISLNDINTDNLYKLIGILFQDYCKYELTLKDNVGFGNIDEIDNEPQILESLEKAAVDFIPPNLEQQLGKWFSDGIQLSGGQWQRVALARCFFKKAQLYILDEPNAALDKMGEKKIMNTFFELTKNNIGIFVSHKIAHVMLADKIIYLDEGRIVAEGTHEQLLKTCPSYKEIYDLEFNIPINSKDVDDEFIKQKEA
ncbi:ABC transporter ATP-binding protein [Clostridium perfringens]|uniref:ABC transporter ATP-binding protein n=3 Tax=Clostridium perfringens TaxID=1502 RepID=UPI0028CE0279|nr:ABC transporter ATP-binding protein [Clostridium perfringens]MDT7918719.1 ABC transporter ATP-binding protein [Clostridium perfringens]MDT7938297.1 ABC transporter ATP-binding protein [Clostridium perfringens]MDT7941444.1 ABC transporter ATP-binding protein [Clostridium perfringens]MDT7967436.1 ABC transporter ATP-binding protein [Clostridium perfringens]MDT7992143.1 ABC transporter ATP-binding protein [Clostridium perfringens]